MTLNVMPLFRLVKATIVLAREGVFGLIKVPDLPLSARIALKILRIIERDNIDEVEAGSRISTALNRLGPSYVKLGQFFATRPDIVGKDLAAGLAQLQDRLPPFSQEEAIKAVEDALGCKIADSFSEFGDSVAAASIAQVHSAKILTEDGTHYDVAVKILRPGIIARFKQDLVSFYLAAWIIEKFHKPSRRLRPIAVVDTLARSVELEMDFRLEAAALSEMAENIAEDVEFHVPAVDWTRTTKSVLTMEWIEGRKLSDIAGITEDSHDLKELARVIIQSFLNHALRDGFFHADMHQGNLFVEPDGKVAAVDFGIMGRLGVPERRFLAEILFGFITRNYQRVAEVHFEAGYVPANQEIEVFAQAIRAIGEPIHGQNASEISMARLLTLLFEVTDLFNMQTQTQLLMLQKTMVVVEGVARTLDPDLNIWQTSEPVVRDYIERNLGPVGKLQDLAAGINSIGQIANNLPALLNQISQSQGEHSLTDGNQSGSLLTRSSQIALWLIAGSLVLITLKILF